MTTYTCIYIYIYVYIYLFVCSLPYPQGSKYHWNEASGSLDRDLLLWLELLGPCLATLNFWFYGSGHLPNPAVLALKKGRDITL